MDLAGKSCSDAEAKIPKCFSTVPFCPLHLWPVPRWPVSHCQNSHTSKRLVETILPLSKNKKDLNKPQETACRRYRLHIAFTDNPRKTSNRYKMSQHWLLAEKDRQWKFVPTSMTIGVSL
jgi:hypothetical protein